MLYHIRIAGSPEVVDRHDARLRAFADIVTARIGQDTVLSCRLPDAAALTDVVALLHDLGLQVSEMAMVPDIEDDE